MYPAPQHHSYCIPTGSSTRLRRPGRPGDRPDQGKHGGKISLEYLGLLHLLCQQVPVSPAPLSHGLMFLLSFLFLLVYLQKFFLLPFVPLTSSSFCLPLAFLTPPLHNFGFIFLLGGPALLSPSGFCSLCRKKFVLEFAVHPPAMPALLSAQQKGLFLCSKAGVLEGGPAALGSVGFQRSLWWIPPSRSLNIPRSLHLGPRICFCCFSWSLLSGYSTSHSRGHCH